MPATLLIRFTPIQTFVCLMLLCSLTTAGARDYSDLFAKVNASVVVLHTFDSPDNTPIKKGDTVSSSGIGSGVIISDDGKILTAAHIVQTADAVLIEFTDGEKIRANVISSEPAADLALLKLKSTPENLLPATLGDSDKVKIGDEVIIISNPYGFKHTLTAGHISARYSGKELGDAFSRGEFLQTDATINRGSSGGPVFNASAEVIGIVSHLETKSGGSEGLGFLVTSNSARKLMLEGKQIWSGITSVPITPQLATAIGYPFNYGVLVQKVSLDSPAAKAGIHNGLIPAIIDDKKVLLGGDVIMMIEEIPLAADKEQAEILKKISQLEAGAPITVKRYYMGNVSEISITMP
jgi:S1-C subfamily serine protease